MGLLTLWRRAVRWLATPRRPLMSFDQEVAAAGGIAARVDGEMRTVPTHKVVGSVGRAASLRSDYFYRSGRAVTERYVRIGRAMEAGTVLPPLELYEVRLPCERAGRTRPSRSTTWWTATAGWPWPRSWARPTWTPAWWCTGWPARGLRRRGA